MAGFSNKTSDIFSVIWFVLRPEKKFFIIVIIYGLVISFFSLVIPVSVQALISTVTNTLLLRPVIVLSIILLILLSFGIFLNIMQIYIMEIMERHIYARITKQIALRLLYTKSDILNSINRPHLVHRYFEIMTLQKALPSILVRGFSLILQTTVGLILVSFYHSMLFAMNMVVIFAIYLVWRIWKNRAFHNAVMLSGAKYETVRQLSEIATSNILFRSERTSDFACSQINDATQDYIKLRKRFFRNYFSQHISFFLIYALGSTAMLGVGGWLVTEEKLTIGQLVAAELIMSAIFHGITRFAYHLIDLYDLFTACLKISTFYDLDIQKNSGNEKLHSFTSIGLEMKQVQVTHCNKNINFDFQVKAAYKIMAHSRNQQIQIALFNLIRGQKVDYKGRIYFDGINIYDIDLFALQDSVVIIDNSDIFECSIKDWLLLSKPQASYNELLLVLEIVELHDVVIALNKGIDTELKPNGYPLSFDEIIRLKIAAAILSDPAILVLNELFDTLNFTQRERIVSRLLDMPFTFIYFSNGKKINGFDGYMVLDEEKQIIYDNIDEYEVF
jgi:putative ABC transport system ATP-binding protein